MRIHAALFHSCAWPWVGSFRLIPPFPLGTFLALLQNLPRIINSRGPPNYYWGLCRFEPAISRVMLSTLSKRGFESESRVMHERMFWTFHPPKCFDFQVRPRPRRGLLPGAGGAASALLPTAEAAGRRGSPTAEPWTLKLPCGDLLEITRTAVRWQGPPLAPLLAHQQM